MNKTYFSFSALLAVLLSAIGANAQTVYSDPPILQEYTKDVKIYFDATGTPLENQGPTAKIYAHTGYDTASKQWNAAPTWGDNDEKYQLKNQGGKIWMLYIGNILEYYNVPDGTNVTGLDFVFRTADTYTQTSDLFLKVYEEGLQVGLYSSANGNIISGETGYVKFTVNTTEAANITLEVDGETIGTATNATSLEQEYTFTKTGEHIVTATATANGETATAELDFYYLGSTVMENYPGGTPKMGPVANEDGTVTFCIGAPGKDHVVIMGSWNNFAYSAEQVMKCQETENGKYFWATLSGLDPEEMYTYYFIIDGGEYNVGDPYARLVLDPYNDKYLKTDVFPNLPAYPVDAVNSQDVPVAIYQGTLNAYDWQVTDFELPNQTDLVIYELLFRDFTGTEGKASGNGTVKQAIEKLDYLKQLGINAIELLPINEFNGNNSWGYNPNFYFAPDKAYGTPDDYKEFIDLCHQNGIAVILDMVFNQSDWLHPWYQMYPVGKNPFYNATAPHAYSVLNDWNQGTPMVQEQWADVLEYWLTEYNVDGFRFDLVKGLGLNDSYRNNGDAATNDYNASRVAEMAYLNSVIQRVKPGAYCINENLAGPKEENEMAEDGELNWANINNAGCQFAMGYQSDSDLNRMYAPKDSRTWGSTIAYLESHDEQRLAYKQDQWGVSGVKGNAEVSMQRCGSAAAQMIMCPGSHMIWMFSEMGNAQNTKDDNGGNNTSPKIVNWGLLDEPNHKALYESYCQLIKIRLNNPQMFTEDAEFTIKCGTSNWATGRSLASINGNQELYTLVNPNVNKDIEMNVEFLQKDNNAYEIISRSYKSSPTFDAASGKVTIPANCYVVIGSKEIYEAGVDTLVDDSVFSKLQVRGGVGEVIVDYADGLASIYSLDGKPVGNVTANGRVSVASGLYIVRNGNESVKVLVK